MLRILTFVAIGIFGGWFTACMIAIGFYIGWFAGCRDTVTELARLAPEEYVALWKALPLRS
jgi:hypothetical protein